MDEKRHVLDIFCDQLVEETNYVTSENAALIATLLRVDHTLKELVKALKLQQTEVGSVELTADQLKKLVDSLSFKPVP